MESNPNIVGSVIKAARILQLFKERDEWGIAEISKRLGFPTSSVHRLVSTLESESLLFQNSRTGRYQLGLETFMIGQCVKIVDLLKTKGKPFVEALAEHLNESVHITVLNAGFAVAIVNASSRHHVAAMPYIGQSRPIHATAVGKCLLAYDVGRCFTDLMASQSPLESLTSQTITDRRVLAVEIESVRRLGYAMDNEEAEEGLICVGAPLLDRQGACIAAMSCSVPKERFAKNEAEIRQGVIDTARQISQVL